MDKRLYLGETRTSTMPRREFLRSAVMLAAAGVTAPLMAAMKYNPDPVVISVA